MSTNKNFLVSSIIISTISGCGNQNDLKIERIKGVAVPRNVIFILSDDHRYDFMGFLNKVPWLQTPNLDILAKDGAYIQNAFVTTSLSSPSRASILTGLYTHEHAVVDNYAPLPDNLVFFPQYLQKAGYQTAFLGKWHMGNETDKKQPGFNHWESFEGQGNYYHVQLNINGKKKSYPDSVYVTDLLTSHAIDFISNRDKRKPFFIYLSHKAVHDNFSASKKHIGMYRNKPIPYPVSYNQPLYGKQQIPSKNSKGIPKSNEDWYGEGRMPDWVKNQRESWHGVDYCYHGRRTFEEEFRKYCESITSLDESIGNLMSYLKANNLDKNTVIIYMGDNGFCWGEHGLIDKRNFYEASVRVPMLVYCPEIIKPGTVVKNMVSNIDIAPTIMELAGIKKAPQMRGESMLPLLKGEVVNNWRNQIYYEYFWEYDYPHTPTTFGIRTDRYKYIRYHGIWDTNEFYDLEEDPYEMNNLIDDSRYQQMIKSLSKDLYSWLQTTKGMQITLKETVKYRDGDHRNPNEY